MKESRNTEYISDDNKEFWKPGNMLYPLPAVMVSCGEPGSKPNIITVAWCATVCSDPSMISISVRKERHSYGILKKTKEFVVNLVSEDLVFATDYCGVKSGREVDKFKNMKLTPVKMHTVSCPGIAQSPVNIECHVEKVLELGSHTMFIGRVTGVNVDKKLLDEKNTLRLDKARLMTYLHGSYYGMGKKLGSFGYSVRKKK